MDGEGHAWVSQSCWEKIAVEDSHELWAADSCEGSGGQGVQGEADWSN